MRHKKRERLKVNKLIKEQDSGLNKDVPKIEEVNCPKKLVNHQSDIKISEKIKMQD